MPTDLQLLFELDTIKLLETWNMSYFCAAVIGGAVVGLLCAILVVMFIVYRMRKKDEGSYALEEPKRSPTANSYTKNSNREFYAWIRHIINLVFITSAQWWERDLLHGN